MFPQTTNVVIINDGDEYDIYVNNQGTHFEVDEQFNIVKEENATDCENDNDVARWLLRTLLLVEKAKQKDENMHCDWSAEPRYEFTPVLKCCGNQLKYHKCGCTGEMCQFPERCDRRRMDQCVSG